MEERKFVKSFPWFAELDDELCEALLAEGELRTLERGRWLYGEGDDDTGLVAVVEGWLHLYASASSDRQALFAVVGTGAVIGQSAALGGGPRLLTAICARDAKIFALSDRALLRVATQHPSLQAGMLSLVYSHLGELIRATSFISAPPRQRMIAQLLAMSRHGPNLPISQTTLAELAGAKRNATNRWLAELESLGIIERRYGEIVIRKVDALRHAAQTSDL